MQSMAGAKGLTVADNIIGRLTNAAIFRYTSWLFGEGKLPAVITGQTLAQFSSMIVSRSSPNVGDNIG